MPEKETKLTVDDTREIAKLARLTLSSDDEEKFTSQLNNILGYFDKLSELDTEDVIPRTHPTEMVNAFREDVVQGSLSNKDALKNAPGKDQGYFKAPKIV